jgi:ribosomal protein S8
MLETELGTTENCFINFENPFSEPISLKARIVQDEESFGFLQNSKTITVGAFENVALPIYYNATKMKVSNATIELVYLDEFIWSFKFIGKTKHTNKHSIELKDRARENISKFLEIKLVGAENVQELNSLEEIKNKLSIDFVGLNRNLLGNVNLLLIDYFLPEQGPLHVKGKVILALYRFTSAL